MRTLTRKSARNQQGFSLIEMVFVVAIVAALVLFAVKWAVAEAKSSVNSVNARLQRSVGDAAQRYVLANYAALQAATSTTTPAQVTMAQLMSGAYGLPAGTSLTNSWGQTFQVSVLKDAGGNLLPIVETVGGQAMPDDAVRNTARKISEDGGSGGFIAKTAVDTPGPTVAVGQSGWQITMSTYGITPGAGHTVDAIFYTMGAQQTQIDNSLHRVADSGSPADNTMQTNLNMGTNDITNANTIAANGQIGDMGLSPTAGLPAGWSGGIHGWDYYGEGSFGMGSGGAVESQIDNAGNFTSNSGTGWFRSTGSTGWYSNSYGGGIYMQDANWVRVWGNKGFYTAGEIQGGSIVSDSYVQIAGTATLGAACSPNGLIGMASSGQGAIQCLGGVWVLMQGIANVTEVQAPSASCGNTGSPSVATCPATYKIVGGGYTLSSWAPLANEASNSPDDSVGSGNAWEVVAGAANGNSCFVAYAQCAQ